MLRTVPVERLELQPENAFSLGSISTIGDGLGK